MGYRKRREARIPVKWSLWQLTYEIDDDLDQESNSEMDTSGQAGVHFGVRTVRIYRWIGLNYCSRKESVGKIFLMLEIFGIRKVLSVWYF